MEIAVASQNKSSITSHTGKCRNFWIYEVNPKEVLGKELIELSSEHTFYNSSPHDPHPLDNVRVLISGKIGKGLMRRLEKQGIEGVVTLESDPDLAVISYLENSLVQEILQPKPPSRERRHLQGHKHQHRYRHAYNCS
ncbi:dinitrogenase iron-molybdenum cofactor biosynthesis protein [Waterburya agarophytonicola K14]|uniref:Dinitrogenase iron-molybdenum cofactor biosynthesis protein n=1 Tax=Waterburya agarophytonicola KI4 TaxID=2874699 RepID=A0A964BR52_9CYAN|nr:NifB/NifX family molybdenum-iron cluster-binding protein [Waterburya agarophytonicola]MCC0178143.1 dinitrogenase iron-molybdenum cofactor biosynthesis protein [Waterburya agarophytonicola KI4]